MKVLSKGKGRCTINQAGGHWCGALWQNLFFATDIQWFDQDVVLGILPGTLNSGTPFPCPPSHIIPIRLKGFGHGNGMGVVWVAGGSTIAGTWFFCPINLRMSRIFFNHERTMSHEKRFPHFLHPILQGSLYIWPQPTQMHYDFFGKYLKISIHVRIKFDPHQNWVPFNDPCSTFLGPHRKKELKFHGLFGSVGHSIDGWLGLAGTNNSPPVGI